MLNAWSRSVRWRVAAGAGLVAAASGIAIASLDSRPSSARAREIVLPIAQVSPASIAQGIASARRSIAQHPGVRHVVQLPAGVFDLKLAGEETASVDVSGIDACPGWLVLRGKGMDATVLVKDNDGIGILGRDSSCIAFEQLTLKQARLEVSQGKVAAVTPGALLVDIAAGFPTFEDLAGTDATRDRNGRAIRWLKHFVPVGGVPRIAPGERPVRWTGAERVAPGRWRVRIVEGRPNGTRWKVGDLLAVTAKSGGQAYRFIGGHDIRFSAVRWQGDGRGKFRYVDRITIRDSVFEPPAPINGTPFLLASSGGGPQLGHPGDPVTTGHVLENNRFTRTGDDGIAMADATGVVRNNRISDATRGILIVGKGDVRLEGNVLDHAPVLRKASGGKSRRLRPCRPDEDCQPRTR